MKGAIGQQQTLASAQLCIAYSGPLVVGEDLMASPGARPVLFRDRLSLAGLGDLDQSLECELSQLTDRETLGQRYFLSTRPGDAPCRGRSPSPNCAPVNFAPRRRTTFELTLGIYANEATISSSLAVQRPAPGRRRAMERVRRSAPASPKPRTFADSHLRGITIVPEDRHINRNRKTLRWPLRR
jgi:hypothetical protein